jgi:internalin A
LPDGFGRLTKLESLNLWGNSFTQLPESFGELESLTELSLVDNELASLPRSLRRLVNLKKLFLHGNERLGLPPDILGPFPEWGFYTPGGSSPGDVLGYYFRTRGGSQPLNEAKVILVGRGEVGKTSLVNRLVRGSFNLWENKTEGIAITNWPIRIGAEEITLHVWDFGGQEIMHATHQFFLTERSLYIVVLNGRQGQEDAESEYWLRLIATFGGDSPVIIVLNKVGQHPFDLNRGALTQKYPNIKAFVSTDCRDDIGIGSLRAAIDQEVDRLPHLRARFPSEWFGIKQRLALMRDNYLTFERYRAVCRDEGEADAKAQEDLAGFLHALGVALNYRDDPRLSDKHVLNPHWVTEGLYTVLNAKRLEESHGQLSVHDLDRLLPAAIYPREMHAYLLELMRKFELCFPFPDDPNMFLVPELLGKDQPSETLRFDPAECLNFEYRYPVLPEGLLPRFIVRTHALSEGYPRWRTGVVLAFDGNEALIKADPYDTRRITISVSGPRDRRRNLLALVRSEFDRIHAKITKLGQEEFVPVPSHPTVAIPWKKLRVLEDNGVGQLTEVVGNGVVYLGVQDLLNGVEVEKVPAPERAGRIGGAVRVFVSYSHRDEGHLGQLKGHIRLLERQGLVEPWDDRQIRPGDDWASEVDENLNRADIILCLMSHNFINSDYCYNIERPRALQRSKDGEASVIPILLDEVDLSGEELLSLQSLPSAQQPILSRHWSNPNEAWRIVAEGIRKVVADWTVRRRRSL